MSIGTARQSSTLGATERVTQHGFAEFVDNVDTRARRKIHFISPSVASYRLDGARCWGGGTTVAIDNIDKARGGTDQAWWAEAGQ
jgi:hypothetical protein